MLEARNICLEVDNGEESLFLLNDVNFCVPRGHFMAIVGPSGCGKTTLLKAIAGIKETTSGSFFWEGRDLSEEGIFPAQGSSLCVLHWQVDSLPLSHQGSPNKALREAYTILREL